jgi:hypothetical protein
VIVKMRGRELSGKGKERLRRRRGRKRKGRTQRRKWKRELCRIYQRWRQRRFVHYSPYLIR